MKIKYIGAHNEVVNKFGKFKKNDEVEVDEKVVEVLLKKDSKEFELVVKPDKKGKESPKEEHK